MKLIFTGFWPLKFALLWVIASGFAAHLLVNNFRVWNLQFQLARTLSDIAWLQLVLGFFVATIAAAWRFWREKNFDLFLIATSAILFLMFAYFSFNWSLEFEGLR